MSWPDLDPFERPSDELGALIADEVLYDFDGPCIFTSTAPNGGKLLVYLVEELEELEDDRRLRHLVATTTHGIVESLKTGTTTMRDALTAGWLWVCDSTMAGEVRRVYAPPLDALPPDALPGNGTMLWPHLEPALRVRLVGDEVREGSIPALVLAQVGEIAKSLKSVFEYSARGLLQDTSGRPPEWLRSLYDLRAQRVAYGSLEISFQQTEPDQELDVPDPAQSKPTRAIVDEGWDLLTRGLDWATSPHDAALIAENDTERKAILDALKRLSPNATGPVCVIEVSGTRVGGGRSPRRLDRKSSRRVRKTLASLGARVTLNALSGRIRDLDLDKREFVLREIPGQPRTETLCVVDDEQHLEIAKEAHYQELPVSVAVKRSSGLRWEVVDIEFGDVSVLDS